MRTSYLAQIEGCMAAIRMPAADPSIRAPSTSSHAYRARYLICARTVKARHGPFGHSAASPALTDLGVCLTMTESPDSL